MHFIYLHRNGLVVLTYFLMYWRVEFVFSNFLNICICPIYILYYFFLHNSGLKCHYRATLQNSDFMYAVPIIKNTYQYINV